MEIRIAAVDDDVVSREDGAECRDRRLSRRTGGDHHPYATRRGQCGRERFEAGDTARAGSFGAPDRVGAAIVRDDRVAAPGEPRHHVQAHPTETNESKLHDTHQKCNHEDHEDTKITKKTPGMYLRVCFVVSCHSDAFLALFQ